MCWLNNLVLIGLYVIYCCNSLIKTHLRASEKVKHNIPNAKQYQDAEMRGDLLSNLDRWSNYLLGGREQQYLRYSQGVCQKMTEENQCVKGSAWWTERHLWLAPERHCKGDTRSKVHSKEIAFRLAFHIFREIQIWFLHYGGKQERSKEEGRTDVNNYRDIFKFCYRT